MTTERIPQNIASVLLSLDAEALSFNAKQVEGDEHVVSAPALLVSDISPSQARIPSSPNARSILLRNPEALKNSVAGNSDAANKNQGLDNAPQTEDSLQDFERGFRFFLRQPEPKHHFDI
ncbi:MAG: hypothetical protein K8R69_09805 [Deltaproteobacteria bacterium]|nr:hypothetical protein [Deltaproteobacteria bacterium]